MNDNKSLEYIEKEEKIIDRAALIIQLLRLVGVEPGEITSIALKLAAHFAILDPTAEPTITDIKLHCQYLMDTHDK